MVLLVLLCSIGKSYSLTYIIKQKVQKGTQSILQFQSSNRRILCRVYRNKSQYFEKILADNKQLRVKDNKMIFFDVFINKRGKVEIIYKEELAGEFITIQTSENVIIIAQKYWAYCKKKNILSYHKNPTLNA